MAKGKWRAISEDLGGKRLYRIGRLLDADKPAEIGNIEYAFVYGSTTDRDKAKRVADAMNKENGPEDHYAEGLE